MAEKYYKFFRDGSTNSSSLSPHCLTVLHLFQNSNGHLGMGKLLLVAIFMFTIVFLKNLRLPSLRPILSKNGMRLFPKLNHQDIHCHLKKVILSSILSNGEMYIRQKIASQKYLSALPQTAGHFL